MSKVAAWVEAMKMAKIWGMKVRRYVRIFILTLNGTAMCERETCVDWTLLGGSLDCVKRCLYRDAGGSDFWLMDHGTCGMETKTL